MSEFFFLIIPSRTNALGQTDLPNIGGSIPLVGFLDSNQDHSAEFHGYYSEERSDFAFRKNYWTKFLDKGIVIEGPDSLSGLKISD